MVVCLCYLPARIDDNEPGTHVRKHYAAGLRSPGVTFEFLGRHSSVAVTPQSRVLRNESTLSVKRVAHNLLPVVGMTMLERRARLGGWAFTHIPGLRLLWARTTQSVVEQQDVSWVPVRAPLPECRVAVITTGGVHLVDQAPFDMGDPHEDPSYRIIPVGTPQSRLTITHNYYDHGDVEQDLNILLPIDLLASLVDRGVLGSLADAYSFMGHIEGEHLATLTGETAPEVAARLKQQRVDAVLLTPASGLCNQSVGLIARTIEAAGIPTVSIMLLRDIAEKVKAPRTLVLRWLFGHLLGEPGNRAQQLTVRHAALTLLVEAAAPATIVEPGYRWWRERYTEPVAWPKGDGL